MNMEIKATAWSGVVLTSLIMATSCSAEDGRNIADCGVSMSVGGRSYAAQTITDEQPTERYASATVTSCDDNDSSSNDPIAAEGSSEVEAWEFDGYEGELVLATKVAESWQVFVVGSASEERRDEIRQALS